MEQIVRTFFIGLLFMGLTNAQEEESAELFLDEYSDEFQEHFFEALTQKGIENYDRARDALLSAQALKPENKAVMHELSKAYLQLKDYPNAESVALDVLMQETGNAWFLETYVKILAAQGKPVEGVVPSELLSNLQVVKNLVKVYYANGLWLPARKWLAKLPEDSFRASYTAKLDQVAPVRRKIQVKMPKEEMVEEKENPFQKYQRRLDALIAQQNFDEVAQLSGEALELFPAQSQLYYAKGLALLQTGKPEEAVGYLKDGLDFLLEEGPLANKMYKALGDAYNALGDQNKANTYFSKIIQ